MDVGVVTKQALLRCMIEVSAVLIGLVNRMSTFDNFLLTIDAGLVARSATEDFWFPGIKM